MWCLSSIYLLWPMVYFSWFACFFFVFYSELQEFFIYFNIVKPGKARLTDSASKGTRSLFETHFTAYIESEKDKSPKVSALCGHCTGWQWNKRPEDYSRSDERLCFWGARSMMLLSSFIAASVTPVWWGRKPQPLQNILNNKKMSPDSLLGIGKQVKNGLIAAPHKSPMFQEGHRHSIEIQLSFEPCLCGLGGRV